MAFNWTAQRERAAKLAAEDILSDEQIASEVGINRDTLHEWRKRPEFAERVAGLVAEFAAAIKAKGIAAKQNRIDRYNRTWADIQKVIAERAEAYRDVPGGETGLIVPTHRGVAGDQEYAFDAALLRELRGTEEQAAKEMGQWVDKSEQVGEPLVRVYIRDAPSS